jgi:integrase
MDLPIGSRVVEDGVMVRRTKSGVTWWLIYSAPVVPGSKITQQVQERLHGAVNKTQARMVLELRRSQVFQKEYTPKQADESTLAGFVPRFLEIKSHLRSAEKYKAQFRKVFEPMWGKRYLRTITADDVRAWYQQRKQFAAIATANNEFAALRSLFNEAKRLGLVSDNPCSLVQIKNPHNRRDRILTQAEAARLTSMAADRRDYLRPLFVLLHKTGARLSELLSMERAQVGDHVLTIKDAKSGALRKVPLSESTWGVLSQWLASHDSSWVFPSERGGSGHLVRIYDLWGAFVTEAGSADLTPHHLRHNFVSQLQMQGVADTVIMLLTGHKTLTMLARYSHANDRAKREAIDKL